MGYTVKKDGTRAWSTTELNCPQTEAGECVCQDNETAGEQTLFDKADMLSAAVDKLDAAGKDATLLQLANVLPETIYMSGRPELPMLSENQEDIVQVDPNDDRDLIFYCQNFNSGDIMKFFIPFSYITDIPESLYPYIKRLIICHYNVSGGAQSSMDTHNSTDLYRAFLVNEDIYGAVRLYGTYTDEKHQENLLGRKLSLIDNCGYYALTGCCKDSGMHHHDTFLDKVPYSYLQYAYIADNGIYLEFRVSSHDKKVAYEIVSGVVSGIYIHLPKNEIIKAIEQEMMGK